MLAEEGERGYEQGLYTVDRHGWRFITIGGRERERGLLKVMGN
jgi:hypothetical protein